MPKIAVTVEHKLGRHEARSRIEKLLHRVPDLGGGWHQRWTSDTCLHFTGRVHGQTVTGEVQVEDRAVKVMVEMPWKLVLFSSRIKSMLEESAQQALSKP